MLFWGQRKHVLGPGALRGLPDGVSTREDTPMRASASLGSFFSRKCTSQKKGRTKTPKAKLLYITYNLFVTLPYPLILCPTQSS